MSYGAHSDYVTDTTASSIMLDDFDVCDYCAEFRDNTLTNWGNGEVRERKLDRLVKRIEVSGVRKDFDCIIGVGDSIDRLYLLHKPSILITHTWHSSLSKLPSRKQWELGRDAHVVYR